MFYKNKMKAFLKAVALGMIPSRIWSGEHEINGGLIVIDKNGEVLCHHLRNISGFENYLFNNTAFDTPSSSRHNFGKIERKEDKYIFKLNLQIRLK